MIRVVCQCGKQLGEIRGEGDGTAPGLCSTCEQAMNQEYLFQCESCGEPVDPLLECGGER